MTAPAAFVVLPEPVVDELCDLATACQAGWDSRPSLTAADVLGAACDYTRDHRQPAEVLLIAWLHQAERVDAGIEALACAVVARADQATGGHLPDCDDCSWDGLCCQRAAEGAVDDAASQLATTVAEVLGRAACDLFEAAA